MRTQIDPMRTLLLFILLALHSPTLIAATIKGSVTWNDVGAADVRVRLCRVTEAIAPRGGAAWEGCSADEYATTNAAGAYAFEHLVKGSYIVLVENSGRWAYMRPLHGGKKVAKVRMTGEVIETTIHRLDNDATVTAAPFRLVKDLGVESPIAETVTTAHPMLIWPKYPGADHYKVSLTRYQDTAYGLMWAGNIFFQRKTKETSLRVTEKLADAPYGWSVSACNAKGTEIAASPEPVKFKVRVATKSP
ncbi:MAG: hypothetical protein ACYC7A_02965 [Thermoanaerobaculia bacterium]